MEGFEPFLTPAPPRLAISLENRPSLDPQKRVRQSGKLNGRLFTSADPPSANQHPVHQRSRLCRLDSERNLGDPRRHPLGESRARARSPQVPPRGSGRGVLSACDLSHRDRAGEGMRRADHSQQPREKQSGGAHLCGCLRLVSGRPSYPSLSKMQGLLLHEMMMASASRVGYSSCYILSISPLDQNLAEYTEGGGRGVTNLLLVCSFLKNLLRLL